MTDPASPAPLELVASDELDARTATYRSAGWTVVEGVTEDLQTDPAGTANDTAGVVHVGVVRTDADVAGALYAAATGRGVVVCVELGDPFAEEAFVNQFARLGGGYQRGDATRALTDADTVALLDRVGAGDSIEEAAKACLMSVRTANRRLSSARKHFGVATTLEAVIAQQRAQQ